MRGHDHVLVFENRVAAFQDADHVLGVAGLAMHREVQAELLPGVEIEGIQFRIGAAAVEHLRAG